MKIEFLFDKNIKIFKVNIVGSGRRYDEAEKGNKKINSCQTNGERVNNEIPGNREIKYLPCKNYNRKNPQSSCFKLEHARVSKDNKESVGYNQKWISTNIDISFSENGMTVEIPVNDECERLSNKLTEAVKNFVKTDEIKFYGDDERGPSKIVVLSEGKKFKESFQNWKTQPSTIHTYCYNLDKVSKYGICETEENVQYSTDKGQSVITNFGFCSSSCLTLNRDEVTTSNPNADKLVHKLLEMKAIYHDDIQGDRIFGKKF